jgi:hypothetical protein
MLIKEFPELLIFLTKCDVAVSIIVLFSLGILSGVAFGGGTRDDVSASSLTTQANPRSGENPNSSLNCESKAEPST